MWRIGLNMILWSLRNEDDCMNEADIHLKLLANVPVNVEGIGFFQLPTIKDMIDMGESKYNQLLSMVTFSKEYLNANDLDGFSDLEVFATSIFYDQNFHELVNKSFKLFFNKEIQVKKLGDIPVLYFDELREDTVLTEEKWELTKKIAKIGNFIQEAKEEEYVAGNERARKFLEEQKKRKELLAKVKKNKEQVNLHSILSAVAWRTTGVNELLNLTIYQLYNGYFRLGLIDNYNHITTGIYTGNVDSSKIKLPDINWANIIKIN
jgi:hypothetical protein